MLYCYMSDQTVVYQNQSNGVLSVLFVVADEKKTICKVLKFIFLPKHDVSEKMNRAIKYKWKIQNRAISGNHSLFSNPQSHSSAAHGC